MQFNYEYLVSELTAHYSKSYKVIINKSFTDLCAKALHFPNICCVTIKTQLRVQSQGNGVGTSAIHSASLPLCKAEIHEMLNHP